MKGVGNTPLIQLDGHANADHAEVYATANALAREDGILGGATSGANVWAARQLANELGPGKRIVTVVVDSGLKYLRGDLYSSVVSGFD